MSSRFGLPTNYLLSVHQEVPAIFLQDEISHLRPMLRFAVDTDNPEQSVLSSDLQLCDI